MANLTQHMQLITLALLVSLSAISILLLRRSIHCRLANARSESLQQLINLKGLIRLTQNHRGLSYRVLNGDTSQQTELKSIERAIDAQAELLTALQTIDSVADYWQGFSDHWQRLKQHNLEVTADNNLEQHNRLISGLLSIAEDLIEHGHWCDLEFKDQQSDTLTLIDLLISAEWIGQARALGSGILAAGNSTSVERIRMNFLKNKLLVHVSESKEVINLPLTTLIEMIDQHLLAEEPTPLSSNEYFEVATRSIGILMERFDRIAAELADRQNRQLRLYPE